MTENKENKNRYHPIDNEKANQLHSRNSRQSLKSLLYKTKIQGPV